MSHSQVKACTDSMKRVSVQTAKPQVHVDHVLTTRWRFSKLGIHARMLVSIWYGYMDEVRNVMNESSCAVRKTSGCPTACLFGGCRTWNTLQSARAHHLFQNLEKKKDILATWELQMIRS